MERPASSHFQGGRVDPFVEQLKQLCAAHPTRCKWVIVPMHATGRTLGERLALEGTNWLNLRFVTPLDIASHGRAVPCGTQYRPFRGRTGTCVDDAPPPRSSAARWLLLPRSADHPTMAQALWTTVRELRMTGVRSDSLRPEIFSSAAKHAELVASLSAYEHFLEDHNRGDMATVYEEAVKHPEWCPIQPEDCWTELPDTNWSPLQRLLMDSLGGERVHPSAYSISGVSVPRGACGRVSQSGSRRMPRIRFAFLMAPASIPAHSPACRILFRSISATALRGFAARLREISRDCC